MKKLFLLVLVIFSFSVQSQIEPVKQSFNDSLQKARIQDSLRDKALLDLLNPNPVAVPEEKEEVPEVVEKVTDTLAEKANAIPDSSKINIAQDTVKTQVIPPDTIKKNIETVKQPVLDTIPPPVVTPTLQTDTAQTKIAPVPSISIPPDTTKPKEIVDSGVKDIRPDSVLHNLPLDSLTYDELLHYYINEPEPIQFYKGPTTGDSVYYVLNPQTVPTRTLEGESLSFRKFQDDYFPVEETDTINRAEQQLKPKISLGFGRMSFYGDLKMKDQQSLSMGKPAFDLAVSQRLTHYLQLDFSVLFGKLGGSERTLTRNENFRSEVRAGGLNLMYDFGNVLHYKSPIRPFVSFGAYGFEYLSKTDLKDKNGNTYYYWSDGSIKNMAEGSAGAQDATNLERDYNYESDIRDLNLDGFGKYRETALAFPIGAGIVMKVTDRIDLKLNFQYYLTTTDYIDGITEKSVGNRAGNKANDKFTYSSFALQYDLITKKRGGSKKFQDTMSTEFWTNLDVEDEDKDGVPDLSDECLGTPEGAPVDLKGCPLDDDNDGIPNYRDDELATAAGMPVNNKGVAQSDEYWQNWYDDYLNDTLATERTTVYAGNIYASVDKKKKPKKDNFVVELVRYKGPIPTDELAFLLSIGDINSTTLEDGTTVVYTTGNSENLASVIKRRDEFRTTGNKTASISRIKGNEIIQVADDELSRLLQAEIGDLLNIDVNDTSAAGLAALKAARQAQAALDGNDLDALSAAVAASEEDGGASSKEEVFANDAIVFRVQLGAFRNRISTKVFNTSAGVLELKTGENVYRYVTKGYKSIQEASAVRADLVIQGYSDAFVTAYKGGKRISMSEAGGTMNKDYQEDLSEDKIFNTIDKSLLVFKVQLGPLKKPNQTAVTDEHLKDLEGVEKETTPSGQIRYTAGGNFSNYDACESFRKALEKDGYTEAFIVAYFKGEVISQQEAMELLK